MIDRNTYTNNFTRLPQIIIDSLLLLPLTYRELRVILLICRLTYGCHRRWAKLLYYDLRLIGIAPSHAAEVMEPLLEKEIVLQNQHTQQYRINEELLLLQIENRFIYQKETLYKLIGKQLGNNNNTQNSNENIPETGSTSLPEKEVVSPQNGNENYFPKKEHFASGSSDFSMPKDIIKDSIKETDKESIGNNTSTNEGRSSKFVDPRTFVPENNAEFVAHETWERLESHHPNSFNLYLWAARKGLPENMFGQFAAEIEHDSTVINPGGVFTSKVISYFNPKKKEN